MGCCVSRDVSHCWQSLEGVSMGLAASSEALTLNEYHQRLLVDLVSDVSVAFSTTDEPHTVKANMFYPTAFTAKYFAFIKKVLFHADVSVSDFAIPGSWFLYKHCILRHSEGYVERAHSERATDERHIGTILVVAPSDDAVGGRLKLNGVYVGEGNFPFIVFIPLKTRYEVTPLRKGTVVVAKASVAGYILSPNDPLHKSSNFWKQVQRGEIAIG